MGLRGEFETEYNNEAEYLLAEMAYNEEDTDTTRDLKTRIPAFRTKPAPVTMTESCGLGDYPASR